MLFRSQEDEEDYATALDAEEDEEEEEPEREEVKPRRQFGFWHKWNSDEADEEEDVQEDEEPEQEPDEAPAPARGAARLFHRQRPVQPSEEVSGTVELPALDAASHRSAPTVDRAPTRPMSQPATPARHQPVGTVELEVNEAPAADDAPTKTAPEPADRKAAAAPEQRDEGATQRTVVLRPEELELEEHPTGSVQLDVDWGDEPGPDATRVIKKDEAGGAPRLLGDEAPGAPFEEEPAPEYVEDYENPADAPLVQQDLDRLRLTTAIRTGVSAVAGLVLLDLGLAVGRCV